LGDHALTGAQRRKHLEGQRGAARFVVRTPRVVNGVVEPGGQPHGREVGGPGAARSRGVQDGQHERQVIGGVVVPLRLRPAGEQVMAGRFGNGGVGGGEQRAEPVEQSHDESTSSASTMVYAYPCSARNRWRWAAYSVSMVSRATTV